MAKSQRSGEPVKAVLRDVEEVAAVEQYWHLADRSKLHKPPKDYK
jgi:polyphosphate kinase